ncbi:PHD and RING finger domain-containing protein 1 isoform X2 [Triplophysa dalaica]|uniref:PHD and RING finger domain-containing protein 1 isoform X2 n=1 Tax=Triplophysa dalaica TaxID=1582913 RepID=UPI0024DFD5B2|nr:PHD and RING finger domain-containing protein 1 isoform X2 [Triplophysa dalaica]XP_056596154.1 PHD and RING finger domain-containing protein 1 isoform X2 [Triplophysa dalaica]
MDEEDSQDELINRNVSQGKGKRPAMSIISDDDNSEDGGESEEGETNSEEDASEDEILDGEEDDEEEDDDSEDEDSAKVLEGAVGNVAADAVDLSSDEDSEKCSICLNSFHEQPVATPEACEHYFCLDCILEWSNNANSCPVDRKIFNNILLRKCHGGKVQKTIAVQKPIKPGQEEQVDEELDQTSCEVCGGRDREDRLLLCDGCDAGYHMECLTPPLDAVPVEEWFCPECIASNRSSGSNQVSEEESSSLPTTSRPQSRPTRAIARTQHSERVRANVNRRRITQARTAAELTPRYLMQSTWLDETINAVVAGLNTAVYVRDLTPRAKSRRRRKTAKRRKTNGKSLTVGKTNLGVKRRKRKARRSKFRRKVVKRKETNSRGRIAQNLGIKKARSGSLIPSVYRPSENSLGSMRAEIGAASLSVYGDPFDLDPIDDREDEMQFPTSPSVLAAKRRGLSRSALRSHQPVARPITAGLSRRGLSIPQAEEVTAAGPVPDLLGSILTGQSMLLMDSSNVVINRDGSLKSNRPVCLSLPRSTTPIGSILGEAANPTDSETSPFHTSGGAGCPSSSPLRRPSSAHSSPSPCSIPQTPTSLCPPVPSPHFPNSHPSSGGHPRLNPGPPPRPLALNTQRPGNGIRELNSPQHQVNGSTNRQPPVKKPPPKPVWVDVSILPRIPKIKKEGTSSTNNSRGSNNNSLPESSMTTLAGDTGREHTVDQKGTSNTQPNRTMDNQRQRPDRTGSSSTFSNSFTSTTSSLGASSNSCPSSSSSVSFRINTSGNPWHARRLSASGGTSPGNNEESVKRNEKGKQSLFSLKSRSKEVKREVYDPFDPTGSDSSDSEPENKSSDFRTERTESRIPAGPNEDACHQIKSEPMDEDPERGFEIYPIVLQSDIAQIQKPSRDHVVDSSSSEGSLDVDHGGTQGSPIKDSEDLPESSITCSVKTEVKSEPEDGPPLVNPQSTSQKKEIRGNPQQGNRVFKELPGVSAPLNATNVAKEEKTSHKSQSRRRSPSNSQSPSKDTHKKKHSRSKDKRRSRSNSRDRLDSKSKERQKSRSRSRDRKQPRSRDRRSSSSSSSRERKPFRKSNEKIDSRGRERRKRSKEIRRSRSVSRSRSRERRRTSKDGGEKSMRHKSRSTSRERKRREDRLESDRRREKSKNMTEAGVNKTSTPSKREKDTRAHKSKNTVSLPSVKQEVQTVKIPTHYVGSSSHDDPTKTLTESKDSPNLSNELKMFGVEEIKQEKLSSMVGLKALKYIKKEEELNTCEESDIVKQETFSSSDVFNEKSPDCSEINLDAGDFGKTQDDETSARPKNIKIEQIWPDEEDSPCCSDNPLVISLEMPDVDSENCMKESMDLSPLMDETSEDPIEQEPVDMSDDDINVDYLIDNLDFIKKEMSESSAADSTDAVNIKSSAEEAECENKTMTESVTGGVKSKSHGKRVTWNLKEPEAPSSEKKSKIALFKLKLKQDGFRRSSVAQQTSCQDKTQAEQKLTANVSSPLSQDESSRPKSHKEKLSQDPHQKDKYMTKLQMQERAIEEVKLAIKPFYQKRDITKEEYKEIVRKAVQKVCHSKSGEINPVKVAHLVKAYVDKYKHARKHKKEDSEQSQGTDPKNMQTST